MKLISETKALLADSNAERVESLCVWIAENSGNSIGWGQLSTQSGFSHKDLITLFKIYKHQTPMAYIKHVRDQKKSLSPINPQEHLFNNLSGTESEVK